MTEYLTTKEVAALLRIKERKVYELVNERAIPVSRTTGKLLFPRTMVEAWVLRHLEYRGDAEALAPRPVVMAGSHDPLLEWALRESGSEIATFFDGSLDGLERISTGRAIAAGTHVFEPGGSPEGGEEWNLAHAAQTLVGLPIVLIEWAWRTQGLVVPPGNPGGVQALADLKGRPFIPRQKQSGTFVLLSYLVEKGGMNLSELDLIAPPARSQSDVGLAVLEGRAEAGLAVETVARQFRLDFIPLFRERYDLAVWRKDYFEPPMQRLLAFCRKDAFRKRARELGGYDVSGLGRVHRNGS